MAATGAVRNFAKFLAPATFGALTLAMPLAGAFVVAGGATLTSAVVVRGLSPLESRLLEDRKT